MLFPQIFLRSAIGYTLTIIQDYDIRKASMVNAAAMAAFSDSALARLRTSDGTVTECVTRAATCGEMP